MSRTFEVFEQIFNFIEISWQPQIDRFHFKRLSRRLLRSRQPKAQGPIHHLFERLTGFAGLLFQESGDVIIERQSSSHIMMLSWMHHDVNNGSISIPRWVIMDD